MSLPIGTIPTGAIPTVVRGAIPTVVRERRMNGESANRALPGVRAPVLVPPTNLPFSTSRGAHSPTRAEPVASTRQGESPAPQAEWGSLKAHGWYDGPPRSWRKGATQKASDPDRAIPTVVRARRKSCESERSDSPGLRSGCPNAK